MGGIFNIKVVDAGVFELVNTSIDRHQRLVSISMTWWEVSLLNDQYLLVFRESLFVLLAAFQSNSFSLELLEVAAVEVGVDGRCRER
jgi:hypothetical protein